MSDYTEQPPSSPPPTTEASTTTNPGGPAGLAITGTEPEGIVGLGVAFIAIGVVVLLVVRNRLRRNPWEQEERDRRRDWDRMARK